MAATIFGWQVLGQLLPELGQLDPWTVRVLTFWPPSPAVGGKVGRDGIIWTILLVFAVVCFVHWSACLRNWSLAWFWLQSYRGRAFLGFLRSKAAALNPSSHPAGARAPAKTR